MLLSETVFLSGDIVVGSRNHSKGKCCCRRRHFCQEIQLRNHSEREIHIRLVTEAGILCLLLLFAAFLLRQDFLPFLLWYLALQILGLLVFPLTGVLFRPFTNHGFIFSKILGLAAAGYLMWALSAGFGVPFSGSNSRIISVLVAAGIWIPFLIRRISKNGTGGQGNPADLSLILTEEIIFLTAFAGWTYLSGFHAEAYGTEKFMDYGFVAAMVRSTKLPAVDIWHASDPVNYYYGGQYFTAFLTKLTGTGVSVTYNLMRAAVAAFCFVLPFSICFQMHMHAADGHRILTRPEHIRAGSAFSRKGSVRDSFSDGSTVYAGDGSGRTAGGRSQKPWAYIGGFISGAAVSLAGNLHYVLYGMFGKVLHLSGENAYYFPDSTRFIGYNPPTDDKCIHEFPAYSFVLGDLHAHMVNLIFVLLFLGILTAWIFSEKTPEFHQTGPALRKEFLRAVFRPQLIACAFLAGMFQWTNYWDFVIYLTVLAFAILFLMFRDFRSRIRPGILLALCRLLVSFAVLTLSSALFRRDFIMIASEVRPAANHTPLWQWLILWGLPVSLTILFAVFVRKRGSQKKWEDTDLWAVLLGVCAVGLILIPEIVYVKDIYENGYARANTMFKLTYQAFVIFGILAGYDLIRMIRFRPVCPYAAGKDSGTSMPDQENSGTAEACGKSPVTSMPDQENSSMPESGGGKSAGKKDTFDVWIRVLSCVLLSIYFLTFCYIGNAVRSWMGPDLTVSVRSGLDATAFLETRYPEDAGAIRWLNENVSGQEVILEAPGDSYSDDERVSAMTGLPTVLGWYVHEWLWRGDTEELNRRAEDVRSIYEGTDENTVRFLLDKYQVRYIVIGERERAHYENLNGNILKRMGAVVYGDTSVGTCIIRVESSIKA